MENMAKSIKWKKWENNFWWRERNNFEYWHHLIYSKKDQWCYVQSWSCRKVNRSNEYKYTMLFLYVYSMHVHYLSLNFVFQTFLPSTSRENIVRKRINVVWTIYLCTQAKYTIWPGKNEICYYFGITCVHVYIFKEMLWYFSSV
jgi:hypothetical protein